MPQSTTRPTFSQFLAAAERFHRGVVEHRGPGCWLIGRREDRRRVIVRVIQDGIEAWQPSTGRRIVWAA